MGPLLWHFIKKHESPPPPASSLHGMWVTELRLPAAPEWGALRTVGVGLQHLAVHGHGEGQAQDLQDTGTRAPGPATGTQGSRQVPPSVPANPPAPELCTARRHPRPAGSPAATASPSRSRAVGRRVGGPSPSHSRHRPIPVTVPGPRQPLPRTPRLLTAFHHVPGACSPQLSLNSRQQESGTREAL